MKRFHVFVILVALLSYGCSSGESIKTTDATSLPREVGAKDEGDSKQVSTSTPDIQATVDAGVAATQGITPTPTFTPDGGIPEQHTLGSDGQYMYLDGQQFDIIENKIY